MADAPTYLDVDLTTGRKKRRSAATTSTANAIVATGDNGLLDPSLVPAGPGVAEGGTTGQALVKASNENFATEWHTLVKGDVGLGDVDNTADADKPISVATQSALEAKQPLDATLTSLSGLGTVAGKFPYTTATDTWGEATITSAGRALVDDEDAAAQRATLGLGNVDNTSDASKPVSTAQQAALDLKVASSALDTDGTLAANSDSKIASQKATKTYVDQISAANDAMVFQGVIDCSTNPNYPAGDRGHTYRISVAGKIGGASGTNVEAGDLIICLTDGTPSGTQAAVGSAWSIVQTNLDGAVIGPASSTDGGFAKFDGTTGKLLKNSAATIAITDGGTGATSAGAARTALGLGTAAVVDTGTSGTKVPLLDGDNIWSGPAAFGTLAGTPGKLSIKMGAGAAALLLEHPGNSNAAFAVEESGGAISVSGKISAGSEAFRLSTGSDSFFLNGLTLGESGAITGVLVFGGATSGGLTLTVPAIAGAGTLTLPLGTDTLVGKATTDVFTNKTFDTAAAGNVLQINGTEISAITGTGSVVLNASPTIGTPDIVGSATNDAAAVGSVGEEIKSTIATGSAVSLTTATPTNVTSISLTAGDWDLDASVYFNGNAATTLSQVYICFGTGSAALNGTPGQWADPYFGAGGTAFAGGREVGWPLPTKRFSLSGTTTIYLVAYAVFAVSTCKAYGEIRARRRR